MAEFVMPTLGADMSAGTLVAWKKKEGDRVTRGEIVAEVETDKAASDVKGTLHKGRRDVEAQQEHFTDLWRVCRETNPEGVVGGNAEALRGADVCIAFSTPGPGVIEPAWVKTMARDAIVFACANPIPEIWPWEAKEAGARILCTGRSDFPNQVNNSLVFPAIFRGTLDVRANTVTDDGAAAHGRLYPTSPPLIKGRDQSACAPTKSEAPAS